MTIKVSTLLQSRTILESDTAPTLGGPLNVNNYPIENGGNPVTITGNEYPINTGAAGQVLTTNGLGILSWQDTVSQIIAGTNITISPVGGTGAVTINSTGGGSGTPGGSDTQLQFNNAGTFGGMPSTWDGTNLTLVGATENTTNGGDVVISGGMNNVNANGGNVTLQSGQGDNFYGGVTITSQGAYPANPGWVNVLAGQGYNFLAPNGNVQMTIGSSSGTAGQVLGSDGAGNVVWTSVSGTGTVTSVALVSPNNTITVSGSPITTSGTFNIDLPASGVTAGSYGNGSSVPTFTVNTNGLLTSASNTPISITPSQAGLGNVTNSLQVINAGGSPSITTSTGTPVAPPTTGVGALYVDQAVTNGNGVYTWNGTTWVPVAEALKLYAENVPSTYVAPLALGANSISLGEGAQTTSTASDSLAIGNQSLARIQGGVVQASGRFATTGDAQVGRYLLRGVTTSNFAAELFIDGNIAPTSNTRLVLPDNSTWTYKVTVTAHRTDSTTGHGGYEAKGVIYRSSGAGSTAMQGGVNYTVISESNQAWSINIGADPINGSMKITVTGSAGNTIRWLALVETVEVTN